MRAKDLMKPTLSLRAPAKVYLASMESVQANHLNEIRKRNASHTVIDPCINMRD